MKFRYGRTILVGLAFFSISAFWQLYDHVVPLMLKYTFHLDEALAGFVMSIDNILALFLLPIFGSLSDRTKTRWGRRMPYIVLGSLGACASMMLIPVANGMASLPLFVAGLGLTLFFMATYRSPAVALMPDVTPKPLRSKGNAIINLMGVVGSLLILGLIGVMLPGIDESNVVNGQVSYTPSYLPIYLCCMGIIAVAVIVLMLTVNEPKLARQMQEESIAYGVEEKPEPEEAGGKKTPMPPDVRKSFGFLMASIALWFMGYNAVTTAFSKYCVEVFQIGAGQSARVLMVAQVAAVLTFIPSGNIATKIGRKKTIMGGVVLLSLAFGSAAFFRQFTPVLFVQFALAGIAWACINVNSLPMVLEMAKIGDVGKFTGYYYTASMAAQIATPILSGQLLKVSYYTLLPYGALFVAASFVTMLFVKHGNAKPLPPAKGLEAFDDL